MTDEEKLAEQREKAAKRKREWYEKNKDKVNARSRLWYKANKEAADASSRRWKEANRAFMSASQRRRKYGITQEQLDEMMASQKYACAICSEPCGSRFHVDHCHSTGAVRGLLCHHCNIGLGNFRDNPAFLQSAIGYLNA